jgi:hypothetical protein
MKLVVPINLPGPQLLAVTEVSLRGDDARERCKGRLEREFRREARSVDAIAAFRELRTLL